MVFKLCNIIIKYIVYNFFHSRAIHTRLRMPRKPKITAADPVTYSPAVKKHARDSEKLDRERNKGNASNPSELFALKRDGQGDDDDDVQDFEPPAKVPETLLDRQAHMPDNAVMAEGQFPTLEELSKKGKLVDDDREPPEPVDMVRERRTKVGRVAIKHGLSDTAWSDKLQALEYYQPRPFEELMDEITQWYYMSGNDYKIFPFSVMRCIDYTWLVLGKRRTGKTTLWKTVIPKISSCYPFVYVFAGTNFNNAFADYVPEQAVFKGFREGVVTKIIEKQEEKIRTNLRLFEKFDEYEDESALEMIPNPYIHIVFDDCVADKRCHNAECLDEIAMYGRHYRCCSWINTQHGHALNPGFRNNTDVAATFEQMQHNQKETVREEWFSFFNKKTTFESWLNTHTKDRNFIMYHAAAINLPLEYRLFKGQADPDAPQVKLGCREFWQLMEKSKNSNKAATTAPSAQHYGAPKMSF